MAFGAGCRSAERAARDHLEDEGLEQVILTAMAGSDREFRYTATLRDDSCVGRVSVRREPGATRIADRMSCQPVARSCSTANPVACFRLALIHAAGDDGQLDRTVVDREAAAGYYDVACQGGHERACNALGLLYADGRGVPRDDGRAHQSFARACGFGSAKGCFNLGVTYHYGRGVGADQARAVGLYEKACGQGVAAACYNLGVCRRDGVGMERSPQPATSAFAAACAAEHWQGCVNLAVMYAIGDGVPTDRAAARALFERACEVGLSDGCRGLEELSTPPE